MIDDFTITIGKHEWIHARHDRRAPVRGRDLPALAVMIHGFPGDSRSYGDIFGGFADTLAHDGFHSLRFDCRGCGDSYGHGSRFFTLKSAYEDTLATLNWARRTGYKRFILIAEGFGATVALTALTDLLRPQVAGMVLLWPVLDRRGSWLSSLVPIGEAAQAKGHDFITVDGTDIGLNFIHEIRDYNLLPLLRRMTMPVTIHHGSADSRAPLDHLRTVLHLAAPKGPIDITVYEGGDHGLKTGDQHRAILTQSRAFLQLI